jgi:hypothetical protein
MIEPTVIFLFAAGLLMAATHMRKSRELNSQTARQSLWEASAVEHLDRHALLPDAKDVG